MARRLPDNKDQDNLHQDAAPDAKRSSWLASRRVRGETGNGSSVRPAPPPPPKKTRKSGLIDLFSSFFTIAVAIAVIAATALLYLSSEYTRTGPLITDRTVLIERGSSSEEVADLMEREGVISRPTLFWIALLYRDIQSKFSAEEGNRRVKSGEYQLKQAATMSEVIDIITSGRSVQHAITIPEGLTSEQIVQRLKESELLAGDVASIPPEGSLLPDTYKIDRGTSRESLLARMQREQKRVLQEVWNRRVKDSPLKSPRELVVLASIVEKETGKADERPRVAAVFFNRLEKKMRLESDPTIIYGLIGGKGVLGRGLTRAEIDQVTPYNTYRINGLPPGPIANPGRAAMEATANPSRTNDLFFVADGTGGHVFAETYPQHLRNVERWRQIEASRPKDQQRDVRPPTQASPIAEPVAPSFAPAPVVTSPSSSNPTLGSNPGSQIPANSDQRGAISDRGMQQAGGQIVPAFQPTTPGFGAPDRRLDAASGPAPLPLREATGSLGNSPLPQSPTPARSQGSGTSNTVMPNGSQRPRPLP